MADRYRGSPQNPHLFNPNTFRSPKQAPGMNAQPLPPPPGTNNHKSGGTGGYYPSKGGGGGGVRGGNASKSSYSSVERSWDGSQSSGSGVGTSKGSRTGRRSKKPKGLGLPGANASLPGGVPGTPSQGKSLSSFAGGEAPLQNSSFNQSKSDTMSDRSSQLSANHKATTDQIAERWKENDDMKKQEKMRKSEKRKHLRKQGLQNVKWSPSIRGVVMVLISCMGLCSFFALIPVFTIGRNGMAQVLTDLRIETRTHIQSLLDGYFATPMQSVESWASFYQLGLVDPADLYQATPSLVRAAHVSNATALFYGLQSDGTTALSSGKPGDDFSRWFFPSNQTERTMQHAVSSGTYNVEKNTTQWKPTTFDVRFRPWYRPMLSRSLWSDVYLDWNSTLPVITAGGPLTNPTTKKVIGVCGTDVESGAMQSHLETLSIAGGAGRVIVVDPDNHRILATSWPTFEPSVADESSGTLRVAELEDLKYGGILAAQTDSVVKDSLDRAEIVELVKSDASELPKTAEFHSNSGTQLKDLVVIDVVALTGSFELDLRVIIITPLAHYTESLMNMYLTLFVLVAVAVILLWVGSMVVLGWVVQPLEDLVGKLMHTAKLQPKSELFATRRHHAYERGDDSQDTDQDDLTDGAEQTDHDERQSGATPSAVTRKERRKQRRREGKWFYTREARHLDISFSVLNKEVEVAKDYLPRSFLIARAVQRGEAAEDSDGPSSKPKETATATPNLTSKKAGKKKGDNKKSGGDGDNFDGSGTSNISSRYLPPAQDAADEIQSRGSDSTSRRNTAHVRQVQPTEMRFQLPTTSTNLVSVISRVPAPPVSAHEISVIVINLRQFHSKMAKKTAGSKSRAPAALKADSAQQLVMLHKKYIRKCVEVAEMFGGVLDNYTGDHALLTFNVITRLADHQSRAASACVELMRTCTHSSLFVTMGLSCGEALIGQWGGLGTRKFSAVGHCMTQASILERYCKKSHLSNLTTQDFAKNLDPSKGFMAVDAMVLPNGPATRYQSVYTIYDVIRTYPPGLKIEKLPQSDGENSNPSLSGRGVRSQVSPAVRNLSQVRSQLRDEVAAATSDDPPTDGSATPRRKNHRHKKEKLPASSTAGGNPHYLRSHVSTNNHQISLSVNAINSAWDKLVAGDSTTAAQYLENAEPMCSDLAGWVRLSEVLYHQQVQQQQPGSPRRGSGGHDNAPTLIGGLHTPSSNNNPLPTVEHVAKYACQGFYEAAFLEDRIAHHNVPTPITSGDNLMNSISSQQERGIAPSSSSTDRAREATGGRDVNSQPLNLSDNGDNLNRSGSMTGPLGCRPLVETRKGSSGAGSLNSSGGDTLTDDLVPRSDSVYSSEGENNGGGATGSLGGFAQPDEQVCEVAEQEQGARAGDFPVIG